MAVLTALELQLVRNGCAATAGNVVNYTKLQMNAAAQAVEDWLTTNASAVSTIINTATSPLTLTAAQKKTLTAYVVLAKYMRDK